MNIEAEYDIQSLSETFQNMGYLVSRELDSPVCSNCWATPFTFTMGETEPVRLSFFDDELEHIHRFIEDKRESQQTIDILPARELVLEPTQLHNLKTRMMQFVLNQWSR